MSIQIRDNKKLSVLHCKGVCPKFKCENSLIAFGINLIINTMLKVCFFFKQTNFLTHGSQLCPPQNIEML